MLGRVTTYSPENVRSPPSSWEELGIVDGLWTVQKINIH